MRSETCTACGASFSCDPGPDCWCATLPFQPMPELPTGCLCPACLERLIAQPVKTEQESA